MRSRLLHLRIWLEKNGLYPKGRIAFIAWYLVALDILLFAVEKVAQAFHKASGIYLVPWIVCVSLLVIVLFFVMAARRLSSRLLWSLRNRLIVTYIFIGVIPVVLLLSLTLGTLHLLAGQVATYILTSRLESEFTHLSTETRALTRALVVDLDAGRQSQATDYASAVNDLAVYAWVDGKPILNTSSQRELLPPSFPPGFAGIVRDKNVFFLRSVAAANGKKGRVTVILSKPFDSPVLRELAGDFGEVSFFDGDIPKYSVGAFPEPRGTLDFKTGYPADISAVSWPDGAVVRTRISVATRYSKVYGYLFPLTLGGQASAIAFLLFLLAIVLALFELAALFIGTRLTRSVTGTVGQIYLATTHVNRGDFTHRIPIRSNDQLAALAQSFNLMTESLEKLLDEQKEKQRLENEITIAQEVQAQLFPRHISQLPSLEVHGFCRPARSVSGDYYDFLLLGSERLVLAVGDVSGKGISAALLMATIHSAVRAYSMEGIPAFRQAQAVGAGPVLAGKYDPVIPGAEASPGTLLALLNHQLYHSTPMEKYATLFLATYDGEDRRLTFSNAGHLPPIVLGRNGSIHRLKDGGTVVGLFDDMNYAEAAVQFLPGDIFLAYSDGVTEPENDFGEFGEERLIDLVQENRDLPLARITEIVTAAVQDWIGAAEQPDDITLVLARAR